ncbi:dienelactone hydrolase family protein [Stieleria sp. ICT_E10.1]|uniref:alpha/beta hydrolase n=1 Tax=Stieleria sedimenti TaxID=2976331 RepID=UPI00217FF55B|nr:dienelactone hydrolase family protein [Stieleria sedimenti]MCS7467824.1 dienelactone hydrolase family protein [Stieleria sedimenti]
MARRLSREAAKLATAFAMMLLAGVIVQVAVPLLLPSVTVAFVDARVFRSWWGFGLRETFVQALCASVLLGVWYNAFGPQPADGSRRQDALMMIAAFSSGAALLSIPICLALRVPTLVIFVWVAQTLLQLIVGGMTTVKLSHTVRPWRWTAFLIATSMVCIAAALAVGYYLPAPRPDETFTVTGPNGSPIAIDYFCPPENTDNGAAVVIFHGVEGATPLVRRAVHYVNAKAISERGHPTFFVRYFDDFDYDNLMLLKNDQLDVDEIERIRLEDWRKWVSIACDAIEQVKNREHDRIAIIGYSLGCYVATAATAELCEKGYPDVVVGNFGAVWPEVQTGPDFPPIHFFHGEKDEVIPIANVFAAVQRMRASGVPSVELKTIPGQGHTPEGPASYQLRIDTEKILGKLSSPHEASQAGQ